MKRAVEQMALTNDAGHEPCAEPARVWARDAGSPKRSGRIYVSGLKVVYLHGIGNVDPGEKWLDALNRGLIQAGSDPIDPSDAVAPLYSDLLKLEAVAEKVPPHTYKVKDDRTSRRDFERRQARVQRILARDPSVGTRGFDRVPGPVLHKGQDIAVGRALGVFKQVHGYVTEEGRRGAILHRILDELKDVRGQFVLIGHSLGSIIAIDLLDHLPADLHIRRFITLGSPAHAPALHRGSDRLLKKFPYAFVDDWSNFLDTRDIVTGGRGLASVFPGAQDFIIDNGASHGAAKYLSHEAVAGLVGDVLGPRPPAYASGTTALAARLEDTEALVLLSLQFGRRLSARISDKDVKKRYEDALLLVQEDFAAKAAQLMAEGRPVAPELQALVDGRIPSLHDRWEPHEAVRNLAVLATSNTVAPYEIDTGDAGLLALPDIAVDLGHRSGFGDRIKEAVEQLNDELSDKGTLLGKFGGSTKGRLLLGAAGLALVAAAPIGLLAAAPASAYGAAAIVGGLAAFGPGGMVGGLAMLGGLASTGTLMATVAATVGSGGQITRDPRVMLSRLAGEYSLKLLGMPHDEALWFQITDFETQTSAEYNRLAAFSDAKSPRLADLATAKEILDKMIAFMVKKGLGPIPSDEIEKMQK